MKTTTTALNTQAKIDRNAHRGANGKFIKNPCDFCGKGCPMTKYFSDERCNSTGHGWGVTLHERCAAKLGTLTDEEYGEMALFVDGINKGL